MFERLHLGLALFGAGLLLTAPCAAAGECAEEKAVRDYRCCQCGENAEGCSCDGAAEDIVRRFGPCACEARKTLFQWSYGTSFGGGAPGWDEPLVTDRPDFTEASTTVGRGVRQLEMGYTFGSDDAPGESVRRHTYPEALLRWGVLAEWLELRLAYALTSERVTGLEPYTGGEDLYLGMKLALTPQEGWLPEMALMPQMTVPTGASRYTADEVLPGVNWLYGWDINDWLSTAGSSQFNRSRDGITGDTYVEYAQSWTIGYGLTERLGAYTEWFAFIPSGADTQRPEHYFDGGFTYLVTFNLQLDVRAGVGLNDAAEDFFTGAGLSVRF